MAQLSSAEGCQERGWGNSDWALSPTPTLLFKEEGEERQLWRSFPRKGKISILMAVVGLGWLQAGTATAAALAAPLLSQPLEGLLQPKNTAGQGKKTQSNKEVRFSPTSACATSGYTTGRGIF